jgi:hypothetical protein
MEYPEHEKLEKVVDKSQAIGEFLSWLFEEKSMYICLYDEKKGRYYQPLSANKEDLIAEHLGIDQETIEKEKQAMLKLMRNK